MKLLSLNPNDSVAAVTLDKEALLAASKLKLNRLTKVVSVNAAYVYDLCCLPRP